MLNPSEQPFCTCLYITSVWKSSLRNHRGKWCFLFLNILLKGLPATVCLSCPKCKWKSADIPYYRKLQELFNTWRLRQNGRHFPDNIFKCIFFNENVWISIKISLKFVSKGSINNIPALVQIMAWCHSGQKPLSGSKMVRLPMHICLTWPQWVNTWRPEQNGRHFADNIFKCIFLNENFIISMNMCPEGTHWL